MCFSEPESRVEGKCHVFVLLYCLNFLNCLDFLKEPGGFLKHTDPKVGFSVLKRGGQAFWNVFNRIMALCLASYFLPPWAGTLALYVLSGSVSAVLNSGLNEVLKMALYVPSQEFLLSLSLNVEMTLIPTDRPQGYLSWECCISVIAWCMRSVLGLCSGTHSNSIEQWGDVDFWLVSVGFFFFWFGMCS